MVWALCTQSLVKQLGTCTMALWQLYQDGHQRERREGRRQEQPLKPAPCLTPPRRPQALHGGPKAGWSPALQLPPGRSALQPSRPAASGAQEGPSAPTSGASCWLLLVPRPRLPSPLRLFLSDTTSQPSGLLTGLREGLPTLGGDIPLPSTLCTPPNSHQISNSLTICF